MTVVSHAHRLIFLKTRKTAGTSIELWLSSVAGPEDVLAPLDPADEPARAAIGARAQNYWVSARRYRPKDVARRLVGRRPRFYNHMPAVEVRDRIGVRVWNSYLKVTVERDSYDRALSMYRWKTKGGAPGQVDVAEFLRRFPSDKLSNAPIYSIGGDVVADVVLRYDHLDEDARALQRLLGLPEVPMPHSKVSKRPAADSGVLLGEESRRIVDQACRHDVALDLPDRQPGQVRR